jgi:hypothetical protein
VNTLIPQALNPMARYERSSLRASRAVGWKAVLLSMAAIVPATMVLPLAALPQAQMESYSATVIPTEGLAGATTRVVIRITSYTSDAERKQLREAFSKAKQDEGLALLKTMNKGRITPEGQPGRKILAALTREGTNGRRLILVTEHVLSEYERSAYQSDERARAETFPLTIIRIQFDKEGKPTSGEVFPGARISVADDGLVDVETQAKNPAVMINIVRQ